MKNIKPFFLVALSLTLHLSGICAILSSPTDTSKLEVAEHKRVEETGRVIKIVDGDTYDLLLENNSTVRIRMNGIDAPEKGQAFYQKAKEFLGTMCFQKNIRIVISGRDRYGRIIADSYTEDSLSLSTEMIRNGFAWQFKKYSKDPELAALEQSAREQRLGLWADANPEEPGEFRAAKKNKIR